MAPSGYSLAGNAIIRFSFVLLSIFSANGPLLAQSPSITDASADSSIREVINRLPSDARIRIHIRYGLRVTGVRLEIVGDSVTVKWHQANDTYGVADIDSIWVQRGSFARLGAVIAAIPCGVYGALVGSFFASDPDSGGHPEDAFKGGVAGAVIGGGLCALPGGILGSFFPRWRRLYPK